MCLFSCTRIGGILMSCNDAWDNETIRRHGFDGDDTDVQISGGPLRTLEKKPVAVPCPLKISCVLQSPDWWHMEYEVIFSCVKDALHRISIYSGLCSPAGPRKQGFRTWEEIRRYMTGAKKKWTECVVYVCIGSEGTDIRYDCIGLFWITFLCIYFRRSTFPGIG